MSDRFKLFYEFLDFRLDADNPSLWRAGKAVAIPPKALEALILLVRRRNEIVSRDDLLETVWKDTFVEEGNINYTISLLRKTLAQKDLIQTVPRRGYRFVGEVREIAENGAANETLASAETEAKTSIETKSAIETKSEIETNAATEIKAPIETNVSPSAAPAPAASLTNRKSIAARWILIFVCAIVGVVALTSFAYFRKGEKTKAEPLSSEAFANPEAMKAYTRGKMILARRTAEKRTEKAIDEFQNAVTLDPTFALAYSGLAEGFVAVGVKEHYPASGGFYAKAKVAAEKSLELDPNLAEGYMIRGWIKRTADWDWSGAEADLRRAVQLNSKNAAAHQRLGHLLGSLGRLDEALSEVEIAYALDPIADYVISARFPVLEARREYAAALREAEKFVRENKANNNASRAYATFLYHTGGYEKVIELGEEALAKDSPPAAFAWISLLHAAYYKTNQFDKAEENLKRLETLAQTDTKALYSLAMNYAELERTDESLMNLERCFKEKEERMVWLKVEPRFDNLRRDARFKEVLAKMNLGN